MAGQDSLPEKSASHTDNSAPSARMATEVPKTCKVILAETIAKGLLSEAKDAVAKLQIQGSKQPVLAAFLANEDPAAVKYAEWSKKTCEEKCVLPAQL